MPRAILPLWSLVTGTCMVCGPALAGQADTHSRFPVEIVAQAGLIQPLLLRGGNVEVDLFVRRLVVGYSHGFSLDLQGGSVVGEAHEQGLALHLPFSTGLSVGYKLLPWLDARGELKWHRFVVGYDHTRGIGGGAVVSYDTVTAGAGVYAHLRPWRKRVGWLKGWNASGSVRFWPNVASTLAGNEYAYANTHLSDDATHQAANIGIANTPFILNVSLGYAFELRRRR